LIKSQWKGIAIEELVQAQLLHCQDLLGTRIMLRGPPLTVAASACQSLGMALNELCTNATKYGSLSNGTGRIEIVWGTHKAEKEEQFTIEWIERGGPPVTAPSRKGFGFTVVHDIIKATFEAEVLLDYAPAGLIWRVRCPAAKILEGPSLPREKGRLELAPAALGNGKNILVVEDESLVALAMADVLRNAGLNVVGLAASVAEAIQCIESAGCDAAVLDINIGAERAERIARALRGRAIPFVTVSGYSRPAAACLRGCPPSFEAAPRTSLSRRSEIVLETRIDASIQAAR
jgi:CheY-like chemotaxis protein